MHMNRSALACGFMIILLAAAPVFPASQAMSAEPKWGDKAYRYLIVDQDIRDVLTEFGRNIGVPTQIAASVGGRRIRGPLNAGVDVPARDFLQRLCESYGLTWYFDGTVLHISAAEEIETEVIKLNRDESGEVMRRLEGLGIPDSRFNLRVGDGGNVLSVSGPPAYRNLVRKTVSTVGADSKPRIVREAEVKDYVDVRVFRGGS